MRKIDTLKEWLTIMSGDAPDKHINLRTAMNMQKLFNNELKNAVVFDNAGGMQFTIWEFKTKEEAEGFKALDTFRDDLIFGWVLDGEQTLNQYQKEFTHWDIKQPKVEERYGLDSWKKL